MTTSPETLIEIRTLLDACNVPAYFTAPEPLAVDADIVQPKLTKAIRLAYKSLEQDSDNPELIELLYIGMQGLTTSMFEYTLTELHPPKFEPTPEELKGQWQRGPFRHVPDHIIEQMAIPQSSKLVLQKVGIPITEDPDLTFLHVPTRVSNLIPPLEYHSEVYRNIIHGYWALAYTDGGDIICISEKYEGIVLRLYREWGYVTRQYASRSYGNFLLAIEQHGELRELLAKVTDYKTYEVDDIMHDYYLRAHMPDSGAMTHGSFWGGIADDIVLEFQERRLAQLEEEGRVRFEQQMREAQAELEDEEMLRAQLGSRWYDDDTYA